MVTWVGLREGSSGGGESGQISVYWEVEPTGVVDRLDMECEKRSQG